MTATRIGFRYFEDFIDGEVIELGTHLVTAEEIIEFAEEFDPAPFHLSEEEGRNSMLGRLSASGWHNCAMLMHMMCDSFLLNSSGQGAPGIEENNWLAPVGAGDLLTGRAHVLSTRTSASRPNIGLVRFRFELLNDSGKQVLTVLNWIMFARREASAGDAA